MRIRAIVSLFACQIVNSLMLTIHNGTLCFQHCISTNILDLNALQFLFLSKSKFRRCTWHTKYSTLSDISIVDLIRIYSTHIQYWKYLNNLKLISFFFYNMCYYYLFLLSFENVQKLKLIIKLDLYFIAIFYNILYKFCVFCNPELCVQKKYLEN